MLLEIAQAIVADVRARHSEGDCPITRQHTVENLEGALLAIAAQPVREGKAEPVAWRAVAHPETGMGAIVDQNRAMLSIEADRTFGKGRWNLEALGPNAQLNEEPNGGAYNVSEEHMFGPIVDALASQPDPAAEIARLRRTLGNIRDHSKELTVRTMAIGALNGGGHEA